MKSTRVLSAALIAAALVGCSQEEQLDLLQESKMQFSGSFEQVASRVVLNDDYTMSWEENVDSVSIFPGLTVNNQYLTGSVTDGRASFTFVDYVDPTSGYSKTTNNFNYAVYPYAKGNTITADGTITTSVPATFEYEGMQKSIRTALMAAKSGNTSLNFKNVQGILRLRLSAEQPLNYGPVASIVLTSKENSLSGAVTITFDEDLPVATVNGGKTLTIDLSEELPLVKKGKGYSEFYLPMIPAQFAANDLKLTINFDNNSYEVNVPIDFNIERRKIYTLYHTIGAENFGGDLEGAEEDTQVWDGETVTEPQEKTDENGKTYYAVTKASDLAGLAEMVNNPSSTYSRANNQFVYKLESDIDLAGLEWTPIGTTTNPFTGIFDGNGHIISNLVITGNNSNVGLFGETRDGEIKNLTVKNAKVSGRLNVGVVVGQPYTSKYTDIKVEGHVEVNGMAYVGGVGGKNAYADWSKITVNVDASSYVNANSVENGIAYRTYVGGVVGFNGEGGHSFKNITSNIDVKGSTMDAGGLFGIAHYGNQFENCVCTGNVEITGADDADSAEEIGGIAGVWNNGGANVKFTNCSFTGTLKTNISEGVKLNDNTIVGKAYNKTGAGMLFIDGKCYVASADALVAALEDGKDVILANDIKIEPANMSNAYGKTGINVKYGQTINGNGHTLNIQGAGGTWDSGINTTGGLIKNITVTGSFRGIFINHNSTHSEKVVLENVTLTGVTYTISCDQGLDQGIEAINCTFNGWTSFAKTAGEAKFVNCSFGEGNGYKYCRPYSNTEFVQCTFCPGYTVDESIATVTFTDCTFEE